MPGFQAQKEAERILEFFKGILESWVVFDPTIVAIAQR